jgi:hypothetical protein
MYDRLTQTKSSSSHKQRQCLHTFESCWDRTEHSRQGKGRARAGQGQGKDQALTLRKVDDVVGAALLVRQRRACRPDSTKPPSCPKGSVLQLGKKRSVRSPLVPAPTNTSVD